MREIHILGHADIETGTNFEISRERATWIRKHIIRSGMILHRLNRNIYGSNIIPESDIMSENDIIIDWYSDSKGTRRKVDIVISKRSMEELITRDGNMKKVLFKINGTDYSLSHEQGYWKHKPYKEYKSTCTEFESEFQQTNGYRVIVPYISQYRLGEHIKIFIDGYHYKIRKKCPN